MADNTLDCHSYDSAVETFTSLHEATKEDLNEFISSQQPEELSITCREAAVRFDDILYSRWVNITRIPQLWESTCWFHATRLYDDHTIAKDGLLPLSGVVDMILAKVNMLCEEVASNDLCSEFIYKVRSNHRYINKQNDTAEGPFGFLIFEPLAQYYSEKACSRDYYKGSELIEDICNIIGGEIGKLMFEKYLLHTKPCAIKFTCPAGSYEMEVVLQYLWTKVWEPDEIHGIDCNTCYSGGGQGITPDQIVELIDID